ncbi:FkbM family methyltransferase [Crocosphaera sp. Alani8]|uniref:FkbM family methyltransferase n=1 Tax=Crocosphaera sp. Alani8 TaxID=3038952 RepID=UPI00313ACB5E
MKVQKKVANWLSTVSPSLSNRIVNVLTKQVSISRWDNRLLGLGIFPIQTIIDIGANEGQSCKKLKSIFPNSTLYAFEPSPIAYKKLKNLKYENFYPLNLAIGKENDKVMFFEHNYFTQSSSLLKTTQKCEEDYPFLTNQNEILIEQNTKLI